MKNKGVAYYFYLEEGETAWRVEGVDHSTYS